MTGSRQKKDMDCESDESERWEDFFGKPHRSIGFYVCEIKEEKKNSKQNDQLHVNE